MKTQSTTPVFTGTRNLLIAGAKFALFVACMCSAYLLTMEKTTFNAVVSIPLFIGMACAFMHWMKAYDGQFSVSKENKQ